MTKKEDFNSKKEKFIYKCGIPNQYKNKEVCTNVNCVHNDRGFSSRKTIIPAHIYKTFFNSKRVKWIIKDGEVILRPTE